MKVSVRVPLASLLVLAAACKPPAQGSSLQSLENAAASDGTALVKNECEGPYENKEFADGEHADVPPELKDDFQKALSAIPLTLRETFSTKMLGKYLVSKNVAEDCKAATAAMSDQRLNTGGVNTVSCLRGTPGEPGVELVVPADKASIRHSLVRAFFAAVFSTMAASEYNPKIKLFVAGQKDPEWSLIERAVVVGLRQDLAKNGTDPARLKALFGDEIAAVDAAKAGDTFDKLTAARRDAIGLAVVRETADQYYCSRKSRAVMRQQYAATYRAFKGQWVTPAHEMLEEKDPETLNGEAALALTDDPEAALSLWGRWGAGNGPMRAWGSSRLEARAEGGRGLFPNWNLARQEGRAAGGTGLFPNWNASRQEARADLQAAGYPGTSLFPNLWANRVLGP